VRFTYDLTTAALGFDASVVALSPDRLIAVTLQRSVGGGPGPVIALLVPKGRASISSSLVLRPRDRADLLAGRLYVQLYTLEKPLGVGRAAVALTTATPSGRRSGQ
jgi:hypothetical protein